MDNKTTNAVSSPATEWEEIELFIELPQQREHKAESKTELFMADIAEALRETTTGCDIKCIAPKQGNPFIKIGACLDIHIDLNKSEDYFFGKTKEPVLNVRFQANDLTIILAYAASGNAAMATVCDFIINNPIYF